MEYFCYAVLRHKMSGTDGDDEYRNNYEAEAEEELGLFGDLSSFEGLGLEEENELAVEKGNLCPHCLWVN